MREPFAVKSEYSGCLALLERYISRYNARLLLERALEESGFSSDTVTRVELKSVRPALARGISLFAVPANRATALAELEAFCGTDLASGQNSTFTVVVESDIARVRSEARRICHVSGTNGFTAQRVATIVSELARNQVLYAGGGVVEMVAVNHDRRRIVVRANDEGPGINNLEEVLSGAYKSKTGMGRGILGSQRLADAFDISTDRSGTRIVAEVFL